MVTNKNWKKIVAVRDSFSSLRVEYVFTIVASISGLFFVFLTPPIAVVDEENHFFRALEVSKGNIYTDKLNDVGAYGANLPKNMVNYVYYHKGIALNLPTPSKNIVNSVGTQTPEPVEKLAVMYNASASYSPIGYIPQAIGMSIARIANLSNESYLYLGRLFNLLAFILITFLAIKLIPIGKSILFTVALLPMTLYQAASLSMDAVLMASVFFLVALSVRMAIRRTMPSKKILILIILAAVIVATTKYIYLILIFPVLIYWVVSRQKGHKLTSLGVVAMIMIFSLSLLFLWNSHLSSDVTASASVLESGNKVISVRGQVSYIFEHPFVYAKSVINLFFFNPVSGDEIVRGAIGRYGWHGGAHFASLISMMIGYAVLIMAMVIDRQKRLDKFKSSVEYNKNVVLFSVLITTSLITLMGVVTGLYAAFTSVGSETILGVQGRYLIPIIPVFMLGLVFLDPWLLGKINVHRATFLLYVMILFNIIYAYTTIIKVY